jgi:single-strand DNA-binding protein
MNSLNSVLIEGHLLADPDTGDLETDPVCSFTVESRRTGKADGSEETITEVSRFEIQAYKKIGELCARTLSKGKGCRVVGRLKQVRWIGVTGEQVKTVIVAENVEFKPKWDKKHSEVGAGV